MSRYSTYHQEDENVTPSRIRTYTRPKDVDSSIIKNRVINALGERAPTNPRVQTTAYSGIPTRVEMTGTQPYNQQQSGRAPLYTQEEAVAMANHEAHLNGYEPEHISSATPRRATGSTSGTSHFAARKSVSEMGSVPDKQKERYLVEQTKKYKHEMEEMIRIIDKGMNEQKNLQEKLDGKQRELSKIKEAKKMISEEKLKVSTENTKLTRKANELETKLAKQTEYSRRECSSYQLQVEKFQKRINEAMHSMESLKRKHQAELEDRVNNNSKTNYKLERELSDLKRDHSALEVKFRNIMEQNNKVQSLLEEKEQIIAELERKLSGAEKRLEDERKRTQHLEIELGKEKELAMKTYETLRSERESVLSESTLSAALKQQIATLEEQVSRASDMLNETKESKKQVINDNKRLVASLDEEKRRHERAQRALQEAEDNLAQAAEHEHNHVAEVKNRETNARQKMEQMSHDLHESEKRIGELQHELEECREAETASAERIALLDFNLTEMTNEAKKLTDARRNENRTQDKMKQQIDSLEQENGDSAKERERLQQQNSELSRENESMAEDLQNLTRECKRLGEECSQLKYQCKNYAEEGHTVKSDVDKYKHELDGYKQQVDSYRQECDGLKEDIERYKEERDSCAQDCEALKQDCQQQQENVNRYKHERDTYLQQSESLRQECARYKDECERLKAAAQKSSQSQDIDRQQYETALDAKKKETDEQEMAIVDLRREVKDLQKRLYESESQSEAAHHTMEKEKVRLSKATQERNKEVEKLHLRIADIKKDLGDDLRVKANQLRETHDRLETVQRENDQLRQEIKSRSDAMQNSEQESGKVHENLRNTQEREKKLELTNHSLRRALEEFECKYNNEQSKNRLANKQILTLKDELDSQQKTLYDWSNEREQRRREEKDTSEQLKAATTELNRLMSVCRGLEQKLAAAEETCHAQTETATKLRGELDLREARSRALQSRIQHDKHDEWDVTTYEVKLHQMEQQIHALQGERNKAQETAQALQTDLRSVQRKLAETSESLETSRTNYTRQRHEVASLKAQLSSAQNGLSHTGDTTARGEAPSLTHLRTGEKYTIAERMHHSLHLEGNGAV